MKKLFWLAVIFVFHFTLPVLGQEEISQDSIEVFLIDSYVTAEPPYKFILSFVTSTPAKSKIILQDNYEFDIDENFTEDHKAEIDISKLKFDSTTVPFIIVVKDSSGNKNLSERFEVILPGEQENKIEEKTNYLFMCCLGGVIFGFPSPTLVVTKEKQYFSLTKEIPLFSFQKLNSRYPFGYFTAEYSYIFDAPTRNYFRLGYKQLFELPVFEYVTVGANWFSNFKGFNGISPEVSVGWVKFYDVFTLYSKYRINFKPGEKGTEFHEITIGLYSSFFSLNLY